MVKYNDNAKHIHRLPPCPDYDVEGFQSWLSDMARQGYLLDSDGFFMGFASFEVAAPCEMNYRLQPAPKGKSAFDDGAPYDEELELSEALGWDYVARKGDFHIYRSADPEARELNTDPDVQAMALKKVKSRLRSNLFLSFFWAVVYPYLALDGRALMIIAAVGEWLAICTLVVIAWSLYGSISNIRRLKKLQKRLQLGEMLHEKTDWKKQSYRHYTFLAISIAVYCALVISIIALLIYGFSEEYEHPLSDYPDPPFATIADFYPDAEYSEDETFADMGLNTVEVYDSLIAPTGYYWRESADLTMDGETFSASYYIWYHETKAPWLARILAFEHQIDDRLHRNFEEMPLNVEGADYAIAWHDEVHFTNVVIQNDNVVVMATLLQYGDEQLTPEQWAAVLAESIS